MDSLTVNAVKRVMVANVVDEVALIVEPAVKYGVDKIFLLNYIKKATPGKEDEEARERYYTLFRDAVLNEFADRNIEYELVQTDKVSRFTSAMECLNELLNELESENAQIYINITGGTYEFATAAYVCGMMMNNVTVFSTGREPKKENYESLLQTRTVGGKLVGSAVHMKGDYPFARFEIKTPDIVLLKALKVYSTMDFSTRTNTVMIRNLINLGLWKPTMHNADPRKGTTVECENGIQSDKLYERRNSERANYQRTYINAWKSNKWIEPVKGVKGKYKLSKSGEVNLSIFCPDTVFKIESNDLDLSKHRKRNG